MELRGQCSQCGHDSAFVDGPWAAQQRKGAGITVKEMAESLGYSVAYIYQLESNKFRFSLPLWQRYSARIEGVVS